MPMRTFHSRCCGICTWGSHKNVRNEELEDDPCQQTLPPDVRRDILLSATGVIVNKHVDLSLSDCKEKLPSDCMYGYAKELLTLVLFYSEYSNAIRGGDGATYVYCDGGVTCSLV